MLKQQVYRNKKWLDAVKSIEFCVLCRRYCQTQPAHRNEDKGMAMKTDDCACAALCNQCHYQIDNGKELTREERRILLDKAIVLTVIQLARCGKIGVMKA